MSLLLDTCALLWLAGGNRALSATARARIEAAPFVYVSVVSAFEIALKARQAKLVLPAAPADWFAAVVEHHGLTILSLDLADALCAPQLPAHHNDPCDRFIIAAALRLHLPVVTADPVFKQYGVQTLA